MGLWTATSELFNPNRKPPIPSKSFKLISVSDCKSIDANPQQMHKTMECPTGPKEKIFLKNFFE